MKKTSIWKAIVKSNDVSVVMGSGFDIRGGE